MQSSAFGRNSTCAVTALSLTTPTVSRDFVRISSLHEHTFPAARESRLGGCVVSPASPLTARAGSASSIRGCPPNISSVTIDHDELCELPVGRRVSLINQTVTLRTITPSRHPRTGITASLLHLSTTTELVVINLISQHDPQPDPQFPRGGNSGLPQTLLH